MRSVRKLIGLLLLIATPLRAQDAADIALMVGAPQPDAARLSAAIASDDPVTRATAARVVAVRGVAALLPQIRAALEAEAVPEVAREQIRALALLGTAEDVQFCIDRTGRFPQSLAFDLAEAVARRGAPEATTLYLRLLSSLSSARMPVRHALWGRAPMLNGLAAHLIAAGDAASLRALADAVIEDGLSFDPGVVTAAVRHDDSRVRAEAVWYAVHRAAAGALKIGEEIVAPREGMNLDEAFAVELARRVRGEAATTQPQLLKWLQSSDGRSRLATETPLHRFLSRDEVRALKEGGPKSSFVAPKATVASSPVRQSLFRLAILTPPGLAAQLLKKTRCDGNWIGAASVSVDRAGRPETVDVSRIHATAGCRQAVETMLRLSFADPLRIDPPRSSGMVQVVHTAGTGCLDESPAGTVADPVRAGGDVKPPTVVSRVEPRFPEDVRERMKFGSVEVVAESVISSTGCVRELRLLEQARYPELNTAALVALSKWKFRPGTLDGQPVDVIFNLTINFRVH